MEKVPTTKVWILSSTKTLVYGVSIQKTIIVDHAGHYKFGIDHVNIQGHLQIFKFEF